MDTPKSMRYNQRIDHLAAGHLFRRIKKEVLSEEKNVQRELFQKKAEAVSAVVATVADLTQAFDYLVDLCASKEACELLAAGCGEPLPEGAEALCRHKRQKVIAAPGLAHDARAVLMDLCQDKGIVLTDQPLRKHLAGIDIGFTIADYGIAETGTLVIDSSSEEVRLATMISEIHVALLPVSRIKADAFELEKQLQDFMRHPSNYLAFITGASRTADIERVLAIGVHGPLALHILLLEDR
jgi:L-lactate dehydrogenase complex protein LldG